MPKIETYQIWLEYPSLDAQPRLFTMEKLCKFCPPLLAADYLESREEWDAMDNEALWALHYWKFDEFDILKPQVDQLRSSLFEMEVVIWELWSLSAYFTPVIRLIFEAKNG